MGQFYYAAKAFDVLERLDPNPEYWEGKRGACVGVFQLIIAGHEPRFVIVNPLPYNKFLDWTKLKAFTVYSVLWLKQFNLFLIL